jgi:hypothetical protein
LDLEFLLIVLINCNLIAVDQQTNGLNGLGLRQQQQQQQHTNGMVTSKTSIDAQTGRKEHLYGRSLNQCLLLAISLLGLISGFFLVDKCCGAGPRQSHSLTFQGVSGDA